MSVGWFKPGVIGRGSIMRAQTLGLVTGYRAGGMARLETDAFVGRRRKAWRAEQAARAGGAPPNPGWYRRRADA